MRLKPFFSQLLYFFVASLQLNALEGFFWRSLSRLRTSFFCHSGKVASYKSSIASNF